MTVTPQAGDFACVSMGGEGGRLIALGERLCGDAFTQYQHAFIFIGGGQIVEAEPGGARAAPLGGYGNIAWSTGKIPLTAQQRAAICAAALRCTSPRPVGYSWLDYLAIAAHRFRLPVPGLRAFVASSGHMICSQLTDMCYQAAGVHLFTDNRWNGYVTPADLAGLIQ
jgi:hypothetical protein